MPMRRFYSNPGSPIYERREARLQDDGTYKLVVVGQTNIQEQYDADGAVSCLPALIARFANGEVDVLSKVQGFYGDITTAPKSFAELLQTVIDGQNLFDSLPVSIKRNFGDSFEQWFSSYGSEDWYKAMGLAVSDPVQPSDSSGASAPQNSD